MFDLKKLSIFVSLCFNYLNEYLEMTYHIFLSEIKQRGLYIFILLLIFTFSSCKNEIPKKELEKIDINIDIRRFDKELFTMNPDTLNAGVAWFLKQYDDFFEIFAYQVIGIGRPTERFFPELLETFIRDDINRKVFDDVNRMFPDLNEYEKDFEEGFKRYKYYFPSDTIPEIISYVGGFNYPGFTVEKYLGIGLDMYLGTESEYYQRLGLADYIKANMNKDHIVIDGLYNWLKARFPFEESPGSVLSNMIYQGKILFLLEKMLQEYNLSSILGFGKNQMQWVLNNEENMWVYLIEKKLLYSNMVEDVQKLIGPAPYTSFFTTESPGRAVLYNGYRIVREYSVKKKDFSMQELMKETDYQLILRESRYNPKPR